MILTLKRTKWPGGKVTMEKLLPIDESAEILSVKSQPSGLVVKPDFPYPRIRCKR